MDKIPFTLYSNDFYKGIKSEIENYEELSPLLQLDIIKSKIYRIFARKYEGESEFNNVPFKEIWNSLTSKELPWTVLKTFDWKTNKPNKSNDFKIKVMDIKINDGRKYAILSIEKLKGGDKRTFKGYVKNNIKVGDEIIIDTDEAKKIKLNIKKQGDGTSYWEVTGRVIKE